MADTARDEAECCIAPRDHNPRAINLVMHSSSTSTNTYSIVMRYIYGTEGFIYCISTELLYIYLYYIV